MNKFLWTILKSEKIELIPGADLLYKSVHKDVNMSLSLEGYPNRDSTQYSLLIIINNSL